MYLIYFSVKLVVELITQIWPKYFLLCLYNGNPALHCRFSGLLLLSTFMACITLLSDFGLQDASVAAAKGILMQHASRLPIVDVSHQVEPYHLQQAAYLLNSAYRNFPAGSFHIVLCNVFYDATPKLLLCQKDGHYFLAPDNGVLSLAFSGAYYSTWLCPALPANYTMKDWMKAAADMINKLGNGHNAKDMELVPCDMSNALVHWQPRLTGNTVECHVIHIDRYENVVINITREQFEAYSHGRPFRMLFLRESISKISNHYSDVPRDEMLCRFNSTGYLEIAINQGKAASLLGLRLSKEQHLMYNAIKIIFE